MPEPLTDLERRVLEYLVQYLRSNTYQPSIREIGREFALKSTKTVSELLQSLADKGWIERDPSRSRGVRLLGVHRSSRSRNVHPWEGWSWIASSAVPARSWWGCPMPRWPGWASCAATSCSLNRYGRVNWWMGTWCASGWRAVLESVAPGAAAPVPVSAAVVHGRVTGLIRQMRGPASAGEPVVAVPV
jgi:hypothetical protein